VDLVCSSLWTDAKIILVTCFLLIELVLVRRRGIGDGAGLRLDSRLGLGSVLDRLKRGRIDAAVEVDELFRGGAGGIGPSEGPGNRGGYGTTIKTVRKRIRTCIDLSDSMNRRGWWRRRSHS
jgi:hypothetical protein